MPEELRQPLEIAWTYLEAHQRLQALAILLTSLILAKLVDLAITRLAKRWTGLSETDFDDRLVELLHRPVFVSVFLIGAWFALLPLGLGEVAQLFVQRLIKTVAILLWWGFLHRAGQLILELLGRVERRTPLIEPRTVALLDNILKLVVAGGGIYFLLLVWDIDIGAWLLSAGIVGIALGLAAKDTLANLFSGIFILADAPYDKGDYIVLDTGERGMVTDIGLRSTRLLTRDDVEVTIPNAVIANAKIVNESGGPWLKERIRVQVGVAYGSDIDRVKEVLKKVAVEHPDVCSEPDPRVRFRAFGDSSLDLELLAWIDEPVLRGKVLDALYTTVYKRLGEEGIEIPFPKRDVYLHQVPAPEG